MMDEPASSPIPFSVALLPSSQGDIRLQWWGGLGAFMIHGLLAGGLLWAGAGTPEPLVPPMPIKSMEVSLEPSLEEVAASVAAAPPPPSQGTPAPPLPEPVTPEELPPVVPVPLELPPPEKKKTPPPKAPPPSAKRPVQAVPEEKKPTPVVAPPVAAMKTEIASQGASSSMTQASQAPSRGTEKQAPPRPEGGNSPSGVTEKPRPAGYLHNPKPAYPEVARQRGDEGTTVVLALINASGKVLSVKVHQSSGSSLLDEAACDTVREWTFLPAKQGGVAVEGSVTVPIRWKIEEE